MLFNRRACTRSWRGPTDDKLGIRIGRVQVSGSIDWAFLQYVLSEVKALLFSHCPAWVASGGFWWLDHPSTPPRRRKVKASDQSSFIPSLAQWSSCPISTYPMGSINTICCSISLHHRRARMHRLRHQIQKALAVVDVHVQAWRSRMGILPPQGSRQYNLARGRNHVVLRRTLLLRQPLDPESGERSCLWSSHQWLSKPLPVTNPAVPITTRRASWSFAGG